MIQFNIQFNIWFQIFIQFDYSFNAQLQLFIQSNYSIQYSFWNIQFKILFKTLEKHYSKFYPDLRIGKNANNPFNRPWICGFSEVKCVENMKLGEIVPQKWRFNKETVVSMFTLLLSIFSILLLIQYCIVKYSFKTLFILVSWSFIHF